MFVRLERKLVRLFLLCILLLLVSVPATATDEGPFEPLDTITMNDGSVLKGRIVDEDQDKVVLETPFGRLDVPRDEIDLIERTDSHGRTQFEGQHDPDTNSIFLTPTPETKGHGAYFRNYMLFFVNWGLAVHENVDVTVGTFLPITGDFEWLSAGIKWRLFSREEHRVGVAVIANGTTFGHGMRIAPEAKIDDGLFDVLVIEGISRPKLLTALRLVYSGKHLTHPNVRFERAKHVEISGRGSLGIDIDGELLHGDHLDFRLRPHLLHLLT